MKVAQWDLQKVVCWALKTVACLELRRVDLTATGKAEKTDASTVVGLVVLTVGHWDAQMVAMWVGQKAVPMVAL